VPRSFAEAEGPPVTVRPLAAEASSIPVSLVARAGHRQAPATAALLSLTRARFGHQAD